MPLRVNALTHVVELAVEFALGGCSDGDVYPIMAFVLRHTLHFSVVPTTGGIGALSMSNS